LRQSSPSSTLHLGGSIATPISVKTSNYTLTETDHTILGSGAFTLTLPSAATCAGRQYTMKQLASASSITITGTSTQRFDGTSFASGPKTIASQYRAMTVVSDGSDWWIVNEFDGAWP